MFCVRFAGVLIAIENRYSFVERLCADYIANVSPDACDFTVSVTLEEIAAENDGEEGEFSPAYCESLALYRKICTRMLDYDAFLFHAAVVSYEGRGFAFTAKSGTGKSTHVAQWTRALGDRITVINGDKPILRWKEGPDAADGGRQGAFFAYGTPYNGKEAWGINASVPLCAVCFIERCEPGEADCLRRLEDDGRIVARIMNQILLPKDPALASRQLDLLNRLVTSVPFYVLRCTPTSAAFDAAFKMTLCDY